MRKQLVSLSLIIIVLIIISSTSLAKGFTPQINVIGTVKEVISPDTFTLTSGAIVRLADIIPPQVGTQGYNEAISFLKNQKVYLDIDSRNETSATDVLFSVVYVSYNQSHYANVNELFVENYNAVIKNNNNDFNPYSWTNITSKNIAIDGTTDLATYENLRIALMNTYNSEVTSHLGYIVTLTIAIATATIVLKAYKKLFVASLAFFSSAIIFFVYRIIFWAWMGSEVLTITQGEVYLYGQSTDIYGLQVLLRDKFISFSPDPQYWIHDITSFFYMIDKNIFPYLSLIILFLFTLTILVLSFDFLAKKKVINVRWDMHLSTKEPFKDSPSNKKNRTLYKKKNAK
jgi:hypothetical protein